MNSFILSPRDAERDLVIERRIDAPIAQVWKAISEADILKDWFVPAPWKIVDCKLDLKPGGLFSSIMQSPEGERFPHSGCVVAVHKEKLLAWTSALDGGFRPKEAAPSGGAGCEDLAFTCFMELIAVGTSTIYRARAAHPTKAMAEKHSAMGFHDGWGKCAEQLAGLFSC